MTPRRRWLLLIPAFLLAGPVLWWVFIVNANEVEARNTIREFHVPTGFTGWATVKYGVPSAPALKATRDGTETTTQIPFPASGLLETRDPVPKGRYTPRWFRADRGGAVLMKWDPPPFFLRELWAGRCFHVYVPDKQLSPEQDTPPVPDRGCDG